MRKVYGDRIINSDMWPAYSPSINLCDFDLWGTLREEVDRSNLRSIKELQYNIKGKFSLFPKNFNTLMKGFQGGIRNACGTTECISRICYIIWVHFYL
jgi:hypothetical protein